RITASPPLQLPPVPDVLPVVTNGLRPSLATPPTPHMAPPVALVAAAHAVTVGGLSIGTPTSQPCQRLQSVMLPYPTERMSPTIPGAGRCGWTAAGNVRPSY